jgi:hypothetical protein
MAWRSNVISRGLSFEVKQTLTQSKETSTESNQKFNQTTAVDIHEVPAKADIHFIPSPGWVDNSINTKEKLFIESVENCVSFPLLQCVCYEREFFECVRGEEENYSKVRRRISTRFTLIDFIKRFSGNAKKFLEENEKFN